MEWRCAQAEGHFIRLLGAMLPVRRRRQYCTVHRRHRVGFHSLRLKDDRSTVTLVRRPDRELQLSWEAAALGAPAVEEAHRYGAAAHIADAYEVQWSLGRSPPLAAGNRLSGLEIWASPSRRRCSKWASHPPSRILAGMSYYAARGFRRARGGICHSIRALNRRSAVNLRRRELVRSRTHHRALHGLSIFALPCAGNL